MRFKEILEYLKGSTDLIDLEKLVDSGDLKTRDLKDLKKKKKKCTYCIVMLKLEFKIKLIYKTYLP